MILVAGGTGLLGTQVVRLLVEQGFAVRILARHSGRAPELQREGVQLVEGDVQDRRAVERAVAGVQTVVSAVHGFTAAAGPRAVDRDGNRNLIEASQAAGVEHFVLLSAYGAAPDHPMELHRMKLEAEETLRASSLPWTILRPTAFMELYLALVAAPLLRTGRTRIFGRGDNPVNFVSVQDVAQFVVRAVSDPALRGATIELGGTQNLSLNEVVDVFESVTGGHGARSHVPLPVMRALAVALRPLLPALARQIQAGIVMDTRDLTFDARDLRRAFPSFRLTSLSEVVARDYGAVTASAVTEGSLSRPSTGSGDTGPRR